MTDGAAPHPGFRAFGKVHREFFDALAPEGWRPVPGYVGVEEKILSGRLDAAARTGALTRLARWRAGARVTHPVEHLWCEEVFVVSGALMIGTPERPDRAIRLGSGTYACRPAGVVHGPFFAEEDCLLFEVMYFPPDREAA